MTRRTAALALACYSLLAGLVVIAGLPPGIAAVCVVPLVLFAPGYAIVLALGIPARSELPGRTLVLSIALSMATTGLGGLVINAVAPLTTTSWGVSLVGFTFVCAIASYLRTPPAAPSPGATRRADPRPRPSTRIVALMGLTVALFAGAITLTELNSRSTFNKPVTVLTLVPEAAAAGGGLRLSVANLSDHTEDLRLALTGRSGVTQRTTLSLRASHSWARLERPGMHAFRASLTTPGASRPFTEVVWAPLRRPSPVAPVRRAPRHPRRASRSAHTRAR